MENEEELHEIVFVQEDGTQKSFFLTLSDFVSAFKEFRNEQNPRKPINEVEFVWSLVGNIIEEHTFGEEKVIVRGSKHFLANTKVYCLFPPWNHFSQNILTIGLCRKKRKFISVITKIEFVTNYRLKKIYDRKIISLIYRNNGWRDTDKDKETIEKVLEWLPEKSHERLNKYYK